MYYNIHFFIIGIFPSSNTSYLKLFQTQVSRIPNSQEIFLSFLYVYIYIYTQLTLLALSYDLPMYTNFISKRISNKLLCAWLLTGRKSYRQSQEILSNGNERTKKQILQKAKSQFHASESYSSFMGKFNLVVNIISERLHGVNC